MMKFILIFGPQASGKMTIGEKVSETLHLPLLYNHITLDAIWPFIGWNETTFNLSEQLRFGIFDYISKDSQHEGIIFTFVWNFDDQRDHEYIERIKEMFNKPHHELYFVELEAELEERLRRNETEHRLAMKPSKRNIEFSKRELTHSAERYRLNSLPGELTEKHYLRLDVTNVSAEDAAEEIVSWVKNT